jgi:hypothetical protein
VVVWRRKDLIRGIRAPGSIRSKALVACACAGLPLIAAQVSSTNQNLRFISPSIIPLAIAVGVLSEVIGLTSSRRFLVASSALFFAQVGILVSPVVSPNSKIIDPGVIPGTRLQLVTSELPWWVFARYPQWDWESLRDISLDCSIGSGGISYLGNGRAFNLPQLAYPWLAHGELAPKIIWLWRYESGPLDWQQVMASARQSDIVLTAPHYLGQATDRDDLDNQYNAEFAARLSQDPRFQAPIRLELDRFEPVEVLVFVKKSLACSSSRESLSQK